MKERVEVIHGKLPIILVAPHGPNDCYTGELTKSCATSLDCNAIINWGFNRADNVDVLKDKADCNRIDHIRQDVLYEEFLSPLLDLRLRTELAAKKSPNKKAYVYYLHGFGIQVEVANKSPVDLILGYGAAELNPCYTCPQWMVDMMIHVWNCQKTSSHNSVYCGGPGGKYSARNINNLCQYFLRHRGDHKINCLQIEISSRFRENANEAMWSGIDLANAFYKIYEEGQFDGDDIDRQYIV